MPSGRFKPGRPQRVQPSNPRATIRVPVQTFRVPVQTFRAQVQTFRAQVQTSKCIWKPTKASRMPGKLQWAAHEAHDLYPTMAEVRSPLRRPPARRQSQKASPLALLNRLAQPNMNIG